MSIIRTKKSKNYTAINNTCFKDNNISARAKGIFAYIMTLPDDWEIYKGEIYKHFTEGRQAVDTAFKELESAGYIEKTPKRVTGGKLAGWDYTVHEIPQKTESPLTDSPENRNTVNPQLLSTNQELSTEGVSTEERAPAKQIPDMTKKAIQYLEEKAQRQFSADHKWLEYFRNDINKLYASLKGDDRAERILKVLEWYSTSDSPTVIISGRDLDEKFNKLEAQMNFKPFDDKPKPKPFVHPAETIHDANPPHTRPGIGEWNGEQ